MAEQLIELVCHKCNGCGLSPHTRAICQTCGGEGQLYRRTAADKPQKYARAVKAARRVSGGYFRG